MPEYFLCLGIYSARILSVSGDIFCLNTFCVSGYILPEHQICLQVFDIVLAADETLFKHGDIQVDIQGTV